MSNAREQAEKLVGEISTALENEHSVDLKTVINTVVSVFINSDLDIEQYLEVVTPLDSIQALLLLLMLSNQIDFRDPKLSSDPKLLKLFEALSDAANLINVVDLALEQLPDEDDLP